MPTSFRDASYLPGNQLTVLSSDLRCSYQHLRFLIKFNIIVGFFLKVENHFFPLLTSILFSLNENDLITSTMVMCQLSKSC